MDIVERLRDMIDGEDPFIIDRLMEEAADEIVRLRHDIDRHVQIAADLATEIERLRAEVQRLEMELARASTPTHPADRRGPW